MSDSNFDGVLDPDASWPDIPQASTKFVVLGGQGGPLNEQAKALAARTNKLKSDMDNFSGGGFGGQYKNLAVIVSGTGYAGTITADVIVVESSDYKTSVIRGLNVSFNGATIGAGGLDTGVIAANAWYYIHVVYNPTSKTSAALLSLSATAPTLPAGYTQWTRVGAAYVAQATTAFAIQKQHGRTVTYHDSAGNKVARMAITPGQAISNPQAINNALLFPPTAVSAEITMTSDSSSWSALHSSASSSLTSRMMFVLGGYLPASTGNISVVGNPVLYYHLVAGYVNAVSYMGTYGYVDNL